MLEYQCAICGKENVKLWRPFGDNEPLICANCAEERQAIRMYDEVVWEEKIVRGRKYNVGSPTGRRLPLERWMVDAKGNIPAYNSPGPDGTPTGITKNLIVDLRGISERYRSGTTTIVPAIINPDCGEFCTLGDLTQKLLEDWEKWPPTR